tara:strand:- start:289 stop:501 length:213 start_codon:yes stop_codon:yes gene_type:complete
MDIKKATINMGRTVNLGNFESARFDLSIEAELEAKEDLKELESTVSDNLEGMISRKLDSLLNDAKKEDFI